MFGRWSKMYFKYRYGFKPLSFAVSIKVKYRALAFAPTADFENKKFFLEITNGFTIRSANYPNMKIIGVIHRIFLSSSFSESLVNQVVSFKR